MNESAWKSLFPLQVDEELSLTLLQMEDAEPIFAQIEISREQLRPWLPWVDASQTIDATLQFLESVEKQHELNNGFQVAIRSHGAIAGVVGLHGLNKMHRSASLGYWLGTPFTGRGLMTRAVSAVVKILFEEMELHRVEIRAATGNVKSRAIPERLGFLQEGVVRQSEHNDGKYLDMALYGLLAHEWRNKDL